ncbi:MAG: branched-chain amino acid transaminase [Actinobacteria bacterium]|nr:MAG: branched-chain amino acid transaminase [Actinomycetota bacterium]REK36405.1 MAG: branched-chain amino acid transaminase [Actinomycetota bacterium]
MEKATYIWDEGELVPWDDATVHFLSHALHYGTGVFEGIRSYETKDGAAVFRLTDHMKRLEASARAYGIPMSWSLDDLNKSAIELLRANDLKGAYIRPLVFHELGEFGLNPGGSRVKTMMAAFALGSYLGDEGVKNGIRARVSSWRRISHADFIPTAKGSGQYLNSSLAKAEAVRTGYDEAIMLNQSGSISEGSGMNLFLVMDGVVYTPPVSAGILKGITRDSVIEILRDHGHEVREEELARGSMYMADEMFLTGTAAEVTPVAEIDDRPIGNGEPGPVTLEAQAQFSKAVRGELEQYNKWLEAF